VKETREDIMTYVITERCIGVMDKSCVDVCPVDCIHFAEGVDQMLYINPAECIDCGACEPACPVNAIYPEDAVPDDQEPFKEINALWYDDPEAARALVHQYKPVTT
jgi:ferredoxin